MAPPPLPEQEGHPPEIALARWPSPEISFWISARRNLRPMMPTSTASRARFWGSNRHEGGLRVSNIFEAFGVRFTAVDVDGAHGSKFFDLNSSLPPAYWRNTSAYGSRWVWLGTNRTSHDVRP
jgi:hypothetical protein